MRLKLIDSIKVSTKSVSGAIVANQTSISISCRGMMLLVYLEMIKG